MITGSGYEIRSREIFERLGWEPIENILKKREIIMTFKAIQDEPPGNIGAICLRMRVFWCLMMQNGGFRRNYDVLDFNEIHQCFFYSDFSSIIWK